MRRLSLWCLGRAITGGHGQFASTTTTPRETTHLINCYSRTGMRFVRGFSCSGVVGKDYIGHSKTKRVLDEETSNLEDDFWTGIEHSHRKVAYMHENADVQRITSPKSAGYHKQQRNESKGKFRNDSNGFRYARNREGMNEFIASSNNNYASTRRPKTLSGQKYGHSEGFPKKKERLDYQEHFRRPSVNHMRGDNHPGLEGRLPGLGKREKPRRPELQTSAIPKVQGEMLFGLHPVTLALNHSRRQTHCLYVRKREGAKGDHSEDVDDSGENYLNSQVAEVVRLAEERGIPIKSLSRSQLDRCSNNRPHQGVCLDGSPLLPCPYKHADYQPAPLQDDCEKRRLPLWLLLYRVQDPMNFGAILRSAYLFGVDRVLTTTHGCSLSPVVSKASAGALEVMDVFNISGQLTDFVQSHQKLGWSVFATSSEKTPNIMHNYDRNENSGEVNHKPTPVIHPTPIQDVRLEKPTILIIGNEGQGLPNPVLRVCDDVVCAAVAPRAVTQSFDVDSLNVSVATGILLHTLMAKRG